MRGALATPPDLGSGVTAFDSRASDHVVRQGGLAESGKATVPKTVVGVRASRRFESCILRKPSWSNGYDAGVRSRERRFDSCRGHDGPHSAHFTTVVRWLAKPLDSGFDSRVGLLSLPSPRQSSSLLGGGSVGCAATPR